MLYLLRASVPDRPGALGVLASAIGEAGGDIAAIDVVERSSTSAVDDILVESVDEAAARRILATVGELNGVVVEAWQPFTEGDQLGNGLDIVAALGSSGSRALTAVTRIAPAMLRARWVVIVDEVYDAAIDALKQAGGYLVDGAQKARVQDELWKNGKLNRHLIARDMPVLAESFRLPPAAAASKFLLVEETGIGKAFPLSGEKLALVLTVYRASDFRAATETVRKILDFQGRGHSMGLHTTNMTRARQLAEDLPVVRVLVNFAHTFGNGGGFDSGLEFTLTMGCGSWQKNSISENLSLKHFLNITHLVVPIPEDKPSEEDLFGPHWAWYGR